MGDSNQNLDHVLHELAKKLSRPDSAYQVHREIRDGYSERELSETFITLNDLHIVCKNVGTNISPDYVVRMPNGKLVNLEITLISSEMDDASSLNSQLARIVKIIEKKTTKNGEWGIYLNKFSKKQETKIIENISSAINSWDDSQNVYENNEWGIVRFENKKGKMIVPCFKKLNLTKTNFIEFINQRITTKSKKIRKVREAGIIKPSENWLLITLHDDADPELVVDEIFDFQEFKKVFWIYDLPNMSDKCYRYGEFNRKVFRKEKH